MNVLTAIFTFLCILFGFISIGYSILKNKEHRMVCDVFLDKFGYLPAGVILAQSGGIFLIFQKDFYFTFPLISKKEGFLVRNMKSEHYDFIRGLPHEMTAWLKIKFTLLLATITFLLSSLLISFL